MLYGSGYIVSIRECETDNPCRGADYTLRRFILDALCPSGCRLLPAISSRGAKGQPDQLKFKPGEIRMARVLIALLLALAVGWMQDCVRAELRLGTFDVDATPQVGSPLAYDPMTQATGRLSCRGIVLLGAGEPICVCAIDWLGVANAANDEFRQSLATALDTPVERVVMHALHQHDAPRCDLSAAKILAEYGRAEAHYDVPFIRDVMRRAADAARQARSAAEPVSSISVGAAEVVDVASNRRMLGPDGTVHTTRYTACKDPKIRALPVGVIDPVLRSLTFRNGSRELATLTFYATHPQSYYRTGGANQDFPGIARDMRQQTTGIFHMHLNGAGGNIGAGKFNDGSPENRQVLADKVAKGMQMAVESSVANEIEAVDVQWETTQIVCPVSEHLSEQQLKEIIADESAAYAERGHAAEQLAFLQRVQSGKQLQISCLKLQDNYLLFMPGELFVEYQLAGQHMQPQANVLMAAYGDYGTGYIGTRAAYPQGGYEVSPRASNVAPEIESNLLAAMRELLHAPEATVRASDFTETIGPLPK